DEKAELLRDEGAALLRDIITLEDGLHDRRVGARAADALLLERLHERRLRVARGRLGEVLPAIDGTWLERVAFAEDRQVGLGVFVLFARLALVRIIAVDGEVTGEQELLGAGAEGAAKRSGFLRLDLDLDRREARVGHLAGEEALPDEAIDAHLV